MGLDDEVAPGVGRRRVHPGGEAVDDGLDAGVAEAVGLVGRGEDDDGGVGAAESAELAGFLEEAGAAFGEGDLQVAVVLHLRHLHLLTTFALSLWGR